MKEIIIVCDDLKHARYCFDYTRQIFGDSVNMAFRQRLMIRIDDCVLRFTTFYVFHHVMFKRFKEEENYNGRFWVDVLENNKDNPKELLTHGQKTDNQ